MKSPQSKLTAFALHALFLVNHRQNEPVDQVDIPKIKGIDWLDIQFIDERVLRSDPEIEIVFKGQTDDIADRVLRFLGQVFLFVCDGLNNTNAQENQSI